MVETISLEVKGKVPAELLRRLYAEVTPEYVSDLLAKNGMPTDSQSIQNVLTSYESGFPTRDLALNAFQTGSGIKFWGIASGSASRFERMSIKYLILQHIQSELASAGVQSKLNIADLNPETIEYMDQRRMFGGKLPDLRRTAKQMGNLENITIGICAAAVTPV